MTGMPEDRRSFIAKACLIKAYHGARDDGRARRELENLADVTEGNDVACMQLRMIARQMDTGEPVDDPADRFPDTPLPLSQAQRVDGKCDV